MTDNIVSIKSLRPSCNKTAEEVFEMLKGHRFFAVSYNTDKENWESHLVQVNAEEIVFGCELLKSKTIREWVSD